MPRVEYAEGVWCVSCEVFEVPDFSVGGRCLGCGCSEENHRTVVVVDA